MRVRRILSTKAGPVVGRSNDSVYREAPPMTKVLCTAGSVPLSFARDVGKSADRCASVEDVALRFLSQERVY